MGTTLVTMVSVVEPLAAAQLGALAGSDPDELDQVLVKVLHTVAGLLSDGHDPVTVGPDGAGDGWDLGQ